MPVLLLRLLLIPTLMSALAAQADSVLGTNGASGLGLVPKAGVLPRGIVTFDYSTAIPGHPSPKGFNYQVGSGLGEGLELNFRLAAQSNRCNFYIGECPPDSIRDLAGSVKYLLPLSALKPLGMRAAIGAVDVGGAATNFRSYYLTTTKHTEQWDLTLGFARGSSLNSHLDGAFGSVEYRPLSWVKASLQHLRGQTTAHAAIVKGIPYTPMQAYLGAHRSITDSPVVPKQWMSFGLVFPMSAYERRESASAREDVQRTVKPLKAAEIRDALEHQGFHDAHVTALSNQVVRVEVNNTAYARNIVDAAGVALGVLAGLAKEEVGEIQLTLAQRNIPMMRVVAEPSCIRAWLTGGEPCPSLSVQSLLNEASSSGLDEAPLRWWAGALRPEVIISPAASYSIGTEVAAIDAQTAVVSNLVVPLWRGATFDIARIDPTSLRSREFERGGLFSGDQYKARMTRRMVHQLWDIPAMNTVVRASYGRGFIVWDGLHLDTITTNPNGQHRFGVTTGRFEGPPPRDPFFGLPIFGAPNEQRTYHLANYRYAWDDRHRMTSEVVAGKFWGQDTGAQFTQRFWFGDSSIAAYYRRSQMPMADKPVAFAGLLFTFPLTPRSTTGWKWGGVRGTNNFALNVESKVGEADNRLTFGYGEIPRFGEGVTQFVNQDRFSGAYYRANAWRLRNAFRELTRD